MNPNSPPPLFDYNATTLTQRRAKRLRGDRFLLRASAQVLAERLASVKRRFKLGTCIGQSVPQELYPFADCWSYADFDCNEVLTPPGSYDLAISLFSLQTINDLPGALLQIRRMLLPDGLFLGALLGGDSLNQLRDAFLHAESETCGGTSPRVSPFAEIRALGALLQRAGFSLPVSDSERLMVHYGSFFSLVNDLRVHGFTNVMHERSRRPLRRDTLTALLDYYAAHHADSDGKLRVLFETLYLTGWSPHESQQKPLSPGSAEISLAQALGCLDPSLENKKDR